MLPILIYQCKILEIIQDSILSTVHNTQPVFACYASSTPLCAHDVSTCPSIAPRTRCYSPYDLSHTRRSRSPLHHSGSPSFPSYPARRQVVRGMRRVSNQGGWRWYCVNKGKAEEDLCLAEMALVHLIDLHGRMGATGQVRTKGWCLHSSSCFPLATRWTGFQGSPSTSLSTDQRHPSLFFWELPRLRSHPRTRPWNRKTSNGQFASRPFDQLWSWLWFCCG